MEHDVTTAQEFTATLRDAKTGGFDVVLPFDANEAWGEKPRHHVAGTVAGIRVRGPLSLHGSTYLLKLGPAWRRDCGGLEAGSDAPVVLRPEGPQMDGLAADLAEALEAEPDALAFWQGLATFYRKAYLSWINGASRRPALREERLRELVTLLKVGKKQRER